MILAFDTSGPHCAAALLVEDRIVAGFHEDMPKGQGERLMPLLERMLANHGATWRDLTRIGVGIGPGNFTGIRISVSAARGLALALGIPAIGVSTFDALAWGHSGAVLSSVDARAGRIYTRLGDASPQMRNADDLADLPAAITIGHLSDEIAKATGGRAKAPALPLADAMARIAATRTLIPGARPAPLYIRPPDAAPPRDPAPTIIP